MKAKHFKKLRKLCKWYDVETCRRIFGDFPNNWENSIRVLAKNPRQACDRAQRRGYSLNDRISGGTTEKWAHWRVKLSGKSNHFRNVNYY